MCFVRQSKLLLFGEHSWKGRANGVLVISLARAQVSGRCPFWHTLGRIKGTLELLGCALKKKGKHAADRMQELAWPAISCLSSWAQWEHMGFI